jgi:hypothetical protein
MALAVGVAGWHIVKVLAAMLGDVDLLVTDVMTGRTTGLARTVRRALASLARAEIPHCVIGATALAVRGLPRMTRDQTSQ